MVCCYLLIVPAFQNLLNNLLASDVFAFVGRIALFFQIITVFPLLMYVLRVQVMHLIFKQVYPGYVLHSLLTLRLYLIMCNQIWLYVISRFIKVSIFHAIMLGVCLLFAIFLPSIGTIIRYVRNFYLNINHKRLI